MDANDYKKLIELQTLINCKKSANKAIDDKKADISNKIIDLPIKKEEPHQANKYALPILIFICGCILLAFSHLVYGTTLESKMDFETGKMIIYEKTGYYYSGDAEPIHDYKAFYSGVAVIVVSIFMFVRSSRISANKYNLELEEYGNYLVEYNAELSNAQRINDELQKELNDYLLQKNKEMLDLDEKINNYHDFLSANYYSRIDEIIDIMQGRADTLKEALNVLIADDKANELIRLQRQANEDNRRHMQNMERLQQEANRQQQKALEKQEKAMKDQQKKQEQAGRDQCHYCGRRMGCGFSSNNKGNCASYIPLR